MLVILVAAVGIFNLMVWIVVRRRGDGHGSGRVAGLRTARVAARVDPMVALRNDG
jgi:ABC-type lipoprotein release transport system permease subunit